MKKKTKKLEDLNLEELSKEAKVQAVLGVLEKAMKTYDLDWRDFTKALKGESCPLCASRIRLCSNCENAVSVGTRNCLRCGESLEKVEIEPSSPKQKA